MKSQKKKEKNVFTVHEAKTHLSRILKMVEAGEEVIIARGSEQIARVLPMVQRKARQFGVSKDKIWVAPDFDAYIDEEDFLEGRY